MIDYYYRGKHIASESGSKVNLAVGQIALLNHSYYDIDSLERVAGALRVNLINKR